MTGVLSLPAWLVLVTVGGLVFAEDAVFVGFVLPGETAAVLGGVAADLGRVNLAAVLVTVVLAAVIGDSVGYEVGGGAGPRLLAMRRLEPHQGRLETVRSLLARRGGTAVFAGRFVAFLRATTPALAGIARMPYPRFLVFNAVGGLIWGVGTVLLGYLAGESYASVERSAGRAGALAVAVLAVALLLGWHLRRRSADRSGGSEPDLAEDDVDPMDHDDDADREPDTSS